MNNNIDDRLDEYLYSQSIGGREEYAQEYERELEEQEKWEEYWESEGDRMREEEGLNKNN